MKKSNGVARADYHVVTEIVHDATGWRIRTILWPSTSGSPVGASPLTYSTQYFALAKECAIAGLVHPAAWQIH